MKLLFSGIIINLLNEGGPMFMYTNLILFIVGIVLLIKAFTKIEESTKLQKIVSHISLLSLSWGFLGFMIGMIGAFDSISAVGEISQPMFAAGLKIALLSPTFGLFIFAVIRLGLIGLQWKQK
jgi:hypothetical protein